MTLDRALDIHIRFAESGRCESDIILLHFILTLLIAIRSSIHKTEVARFTLLYTVSFCGLTTFL
jgi:hypothetical protein